MNTLQELAADGARGLFFRIDFLPPRLLTAATANALEGAGVKLFFENGRPARCLARRGRLSNKAVHSFQLRL